MFAYYLQDEPVLMLFSMGYLCHKWPWICSVWRNNILILSSFMSHHQGCSKSNTTGVTIRSYIAYPSGANSGFEWVGVAQSLVLYVVYTIVCHINCGLLCGHRFTASDQSFDCFLLNCSLVYKMVFF